MSFFWHMVVLDQEEESNSVDKREIEKIIHQVADELGIKVLELAINPKLIRLFVSGCPTILVNVIKRIKGRSLDILRKEFPELLKLPSLWTRSHYASTIGSVSKETIEKYIQDQKGG